MTFDPIPRLKARVTALFREASYYHVSMSLVDEDNPEHLMQMAEFEAALDLLDRLVTVDDRFPNSRALRAVRDTLVRYHRNIQGVLPMAQLQLERLIREINMVEKAAAATRDRELAL